MKVLFGEPKEKEYVKRQIKNGEKISEVILGEDLLIHRYFFRTSYIGYDQIRRIYKRIESGEYGDFAVSEYSLVIVDRNNQEHKLHIDRMEYADEIQEIVKKRYPAIAVGKMQE